MIYVFAWCTDYFVDFSTHRFPGMFHMYIYEHFYVSIFTDFYIILIMPKPDNNKNFLIKTLKFKSTQLKKVKTRVGPMVL